MNAKPVMSALLLALLSACGSGGSEPAATAAPTPAPAQAAPVASPTPAPAPVAVASDPAPAPAPSPTPSPIPATPAPPTYTQAQWQIIGTIEEEIAKVTTHKLATDTQVPGWLAHFEPRKSWWPEYVWRQEMRKIAIEDGSRFGWPDAPSRSQYTDKGALISVLTCRNFQASDGFLTRYWVDDSAIYSNGTRTLDFSTLMPDQYTKLVIFDQGSQFVISINSQYPTASASGQYTVEVPSGRVSQNSYATNSSRMDCE